MGCCGSVDKKVAPAEEETHEDTKDQEQHTNEINPVRAPTTAREKDSLEATELEKKKKKRKEKKEKKEKKKKKDKEGGLPKLGALKVVGKLNDKIDDSDFTYLQKVEQNTCLEIKLARWRGKKAKSCPLDIPSLAMALSRHSACLKTLFLGRNELDDDAIKPLIDALSINSSITRLGLDSNNLTQKSAKALAETLMKSNTTLTYLDLNSNKIGEEGATALAEALRSPLCALEVLNLNGNLIGNAGAATLAAAIRGNKRLECLSLSYNTDIGDEGCISLMKVFEENDIGTMENPPNFKLKQLMLMQTSGSVETLGSIRQYLRRNETLDEKT